MALQHTAGGTLLLTASGALADECCCGGPPPSDCTWFLSPNTLAFDCLAQSGSFNINVPTGTNCGWSASVTSGGAFTTITAGFTGNTDGTVEFDLLDNSGVDRTAEITVVTTIVSSLGPIGSVIGVFTINQAECAMGGGGGGGGGDFVPGAGGGSPPAPGSGCSWSVGPSSFLFTCFPQGGFFNVHTQLGCGWEAIVFSGGSFITITSGTPGSDAGSVFFTVSANGGAARGGQIYVQTTVVSGYGPIGTLVGIVNIVQATCPGGGGGAPCSWEATGSWYVGNACDGESGNFEVITYAGCGWEAIAQDPWITITSGSTGLSTGTIMFDVDANKTGAERTGTITVHQTSASVLGPAGTQVGLVTIIEPDCASILLEPAMRASNERRARVNLSGATYPNRRFDENGLIAGAGEAPPTEAGATFYLGNASTYSMPPNYFYYYDLVNYDAFFGDPAGTRAAQLVNTIRTNINSDVLLNLYVDLTTPIVGAAAITVYSTGTLPVPAVATTATYEDRLTDLRDAIRKLTTTFSTAVAQAPLASSKRVVSATDTTVPPARTCLLSQFTVVAQPSDTIFSAGCVNSMTPTGDGVPIGLMMANTSAAGPPVSITGHSIRVQYTCDISAYTVVTDSNIYAIFGLINVYGGVRTYIPASAFGSPAEDTFAFLGAGANVTTSQADMDVDASTVISAISSDSQQKGWNIRSPNCVIELGFTTVI